MQVNEPTQMNQIVNKQELPNNWQAINFIGVTLTGFIAIQLCICSTKVTIKDATDKGPRDLIEFKLQTLKIRLVDFRYFRISRCQSMTIPVRSDGGFYSYETRTTADSKFFDMLQMNVWFTKNNCQNGDVFNYL